jgi:hypothetical protein
MVSRTDPLLAAGHVSCSVCHTVTYPVEARWLDETWLIARFSVACEHVRTTVRMVAAATLPIDRRCQAVTSRGTRCKLPVVKGGWCGVHVPESVLHRGQ